MAEQCPYAIGYSVMRNDDPRGQFYNWNTMRAMMVNGDSTGGREVGASLTNEPFVWTQFVDWSPDGRLTILNRSWESPENYAWEREHKTFRMTEGWLLDSCLVDLTTGAVENLTSVERVSRYNSGLFFWPGDRNRLGFQALIDSISHPFSMDRDGRNKRDLSTGKSEFTYGFHASPDGKRIAYHKSYQIYIADADGSNAARVETGHPFCFSPTWSPDGAWLLFVDGEHYDCHPTIVRADGTALRRVASRGGYRGVIQLLVHPDFHSESSDTPCWSAEGKWIFYTALIDGATELMRVSTAGLVERLTHSRPGVRHSHPAGSPDGGWVVFTSDRSGRLQHYVARADGRDVLAVTDVPAGHAAMHPRWRPVPGRLPAESPSVPAR